MSSVIVRIGLSGLGPQRQAMSRCVRGVLADPVFLGGRESPTVKKTNRCNPKFVFYKCEIMICSANPIMRRVAKKHILGPV